MTDKLNLEAIEGRALMAAAAWKDTLGDRTVPEISPAMEETRDSERDRIDMMAHVEAGIHSPARCLFTRTCFSRI
jgi:hypothetical protein